jgi:protein-disulfide isomerase
VHRPGSSTGATGEHDGDPSRRGQMLMLARIEEGIDHVRGPADGRLVLEYGDYECPFSRQAFRSIERVERLDPGGIRFAFRHFPLTEIHPHAFAAAAAAEAAAFQGAFWKMHDLLFHRQRALEDDDLRSYAGELGLDVDRFERDRRGREAVARVTRDVASGDASGEVFGTPTLFVDGVVYRGDHDTEALLRALA